MTIEFVRYSKVFQWIKSKQRVFMFEKVGTSDLVCLIYLVEVLRRNLSNPKLNDISFEIRLKCELIETFEGCEEVCLT